MTLADGWTDPELARDGPLNKESADRLLQRGNDALAAADFGPAARYFQRVVGATPDPEHTAAALYGLGMALYRMDQDDAARSTWEQILALPETSYTYRAMREIAGARVRDGDLKGAQRAYLDAQRRAPAEDRAEIQSRLGWLAKETGDASTANRYFARSRGDVAPPYLTFGLIAVTVVVSLVAFQQGENGWLYRNLQLDKVALARGEYWRLWTVTLLHGSYLHLFFNMYALYLAGVLVERLYGPFLMLPMYFLAAAAGSVGSFLVGGDVPSVGASGAIFGLFGVLLAVSRTYKPMLDRRNTMLLGQMGALIVVNLVFGFLAPGIDIWAHIGGLLAGLWLGFLLPPTRVPSMGSLWQRPTGAGGGPTPVGPGFLRVIGVLALVVVIAGGVALGTANRHPIRGRGGQTGAAPPTTVAALAESRSGDAPSV